MDNSLDLIIHVHMYHWFHYILYVYLYTLDHIHVYTPRYGFYHSACLGSLPLSLSLSLSLWESACTTVMTYQSAKGKRASSEKWQRSKKKITSHVSNANPLSEYYCCAIPNMSQALYCSTRHDGIERQNHPASFSFFWYLPEFNNNISLHKETIYLSR